MISAAFDADQFSPQGLIWRKSFSSDQAGPFNRIIAACDLW